MRTGHTQPITIETALHERLDALARREGMSLSDLADDVLRTYVDAAERGLGEAAEDEQRWERYKHSGTIIPADRMRERLARLATIAAREAGE